MYKVSRLSTRTIAYLPSLRSAGQRVHRGLNPATCPVSLAEPTLQKKTEVNLIEATYYSKDLPLPGCVLPVTCQLPAVAMDSTQHGQSVKSLPPKVEVNVAECPEASQRYFLDLFTDVHLKGGLCIVTLSECTDQDMSTWSSSVEEEREELTKHFIEMASEVCARLSREGHWADFVDPSSGRAFYSPHSNNILMETDAKFAMLGFDIVDLGCCKAIAHPKWGTHIFIGTIFTDAPSESLAVAVTALAPS